MALFTQLSIDWFARLLLSRLPSLGPDASRLALRELILPLHQFDHKWRSITPGRLNPDLADGPGAKALTKLSEEERTRLVGAHKEWARAEALKRADSQRDDRAEQDETDKASLLRIEAGEGMAGDGGEGGSGGSGEGSGGGGGNGSSWTQAAERTDHDWIAGQELLE